MNSVLLRILQEPVAVTADVEDMFHHVVVEPEDVDALRFFRFPDGDLDNEPEEYRMLVQLLGGVWSSGFAGFALIRNSLNNAVRFQADTTETVLSNFHVDDLFKSIYEDIT